MMPGSSRFMHGLTLVEMLFVVAVSATLFVAINDVMGRALEAREVAVQRNDLTREIEFVGQRLHAAVRNSARVILPTNDNPNTAWDESVRNPGVLAMTIDPARDLDADGVPDADNDGDGRIDEDPGGDIYQNGVPGLADIDDDGDGLIDEGDFKDDDEDGTTDEDGWNDVDDDGDGVADEDTMPDANQDGAPGRIGIDDDGDGATDEGNPADDDEDGTPNDDWVDAAVYYLDGTTLYERIPVPWDENADAIVDGSDTVTSVLTANVSSFAVRRLAKSGGARHPLIEIKLTLADASGETADLAFRARIGANQ